MSAEHWDLDQDNTLGGNSPSPNKVSSQKALKEYIDSHGGGSTVDQEFDASSEDAQSGIAIAGELDKYPEKAQNENITGIYNFVGQKRITFSQSIASDKLGFTCFNVSNTELGAFEWRPSTIGGGALLNVNVPYSSSNYVGFRYWGTAVNVIAPKVETAGNYYIPTHITDGTNTVTANSSGSVNISSLLPDISNFVTNSSLATTLADYVTNSSLATTLSSYTLSSNLSNVATSGSYTDLINKPTIPAAVTENTVSGWGFTKNAGTITGIRMNGSSKGASGVVDLGTVITEHQDISGKQNKISIIYGV